MVTHNGSIEKASGHVEADETFIGGKARNMHIAERKRRITGTGGKDKTAVLGIVERGGRTIAKTVPDLKGGVSPSVHLREHQSRVGRIYGRVAHLRFTQERWLRSQGGQSFQKGVAEVQTVAGKKG